MTRETSTLLAALHAEREAGAWYARRVTEHQHHLTLKASGRGNAAATEAATAHVREVDRRAMERLAELTVAAECGDTLDRAAGRLWITPGSLRSWLRDNEPALLARFVENGRAA